MKATGATLLYLYQNLHRELRVKPDWVRKVMNLSNNVMADCIREVEVDNNDKAVVVTNRYEFQKFCKVAHCRAAGVAALLKLDNEFDINDINRVVEAINNGRHDKTLLQTDDINQAALALLQADMHIDDSAPPEIGTPPPRKGRGIPPYLRASDFADLESRVEKHGQKRSRALRSTPSTPATPSGQSASSSANTPGPSDSSTQSTPGPYIPPPKKARKSTPRKPATPTAEGPGRHEITAAEHSNEKRIQEEIISTLREKVLSSKSSPPCQVLLVDASVERFQWNQDTFDEMIGRFDTNQQSSTYCLVFCYCASIIYLIRFFFFCRKLHAGIDHSYY